MDPLANARMEMAGHFIERKFSLAKVMEYSNNFKQSANGREDRHFAFRNILVISPERIR